MDNRIKIHCPVCNRTMGYVEAPSTGFFRTKCPRCGKEIRINLTQPGAVMARLAAERRETKATA